MTSQDFSAHGSDRTLYLIDGHAQIFRAYYAIRGGMNSPVTGEPTQAVFGFAGMLLKFFSLCRPRHVIMAIDLPGKTFRDELYPQYKAQRPPAPPDLHTQAQRIFEMTAMFGIRVLGVPGAEADDVIATLTRMVLHDPAKADWQVRIISKDKDLEQLLCDRVCLYDIHTDLYLDPARLLAEKGIRPEQVVDVLALMGDASDNIPGVEGIGPKTAAELIQQYGSIDNVLANIDKIKGKRRENLEKGRALLPLSRQLVQLKYDVALGLDLSAAVVGPPQGEALHLLFTQMGFNRHQRELERFLGQSGSATAPAAVPPATVSSQAPAGGASFSLAAPLSSSSPRGSKSKAKSPAASVQGGLFADFDPAPAQANSLPASAAPVDGAVGASASIKPQASDLSPFDYRAILTREDLVSLVDELRVQQLIAIDTETIGLGHRAPICGMSLAWKPNAAVYIPLRAPADVPCLALETVQELLGPILASAIPKCGHNLKYDWLILRNAGFPMRGIVFDSMIASHLLGYPAHGLDDLALQKFGHRMMQIRDLLGEDAGAATGVFPRTMDQVPLAQIVPYACDDAHISWKLFHALQPELAAQGLEELAGKVEMPLVEVLADMEFQGIRVDPAVLDEQKAALAQRIVSLRSQIYAAVDTPPFNLDSPRQLGDILFNHLKMPVIKRNKTGASTDSQVLETLMEHPDVAPPHAKWLELITEYRQLTKLVNTYLEALKESIYPLTGRIHAQFHQTGAATGRLSSSDPNLQNIPIRTDTGRQIRKAFVAAPEHLLICADYSQIELRILAHLSGDANLRQAFAADLDIHAAVAAQVFNVPLDQVTKDMRAHAKVVNFGIVYGVTPFGLARRIEGMTVDAARTLIGDYRRKFSGIGAFLDKCIQEAEEKGYVTTILGRRRPIPQIKAANANQRALGERLAINSVVQGSAADLIKLAMVNLRRRLLNENQPARLLLQIHDELLLEAPSADAPVIAGIVKEEMESAMTLTVPLRVDAGIGADWLAAKD